MTLGIFDSGVGGFSVLKRVLEKHRDISCLYLGDTARVPYGEKSFSEIRLIAKEVMNWLIDQNVSTVLVACNTTNSMALDIVKSFESVSVISLIEEVPSLISEKRVGILATPATTSSLSYTKRIQAYSSDTFVIEQACPELVPLIESGNYDGPEVFRLVQDYLAPLLRENVKAIVYGCSHYPFLEPVFRKLVPSDVRLIDPSIGLVKKLSMIMEPSCPSPIKIDSPFNLSKIRICVTSDPQGFAARAVPLLGVTPQVELVSLLSKAYSF